VATCSVVSESLHITLEAPPWWNTRQYTHVLYIFRN